MQRAREELLAGPALPFDQHRRIGRGRALQRRKHLAQRGIFADQLRRAASDRQLLLQQQVLVDDAALFESAADEQEQVLGVDRLGEEVEGPFLHRADGVLERAERGHDDHRDLFVQLFRGPQDGEAIPFRKPQIGEHERRLRLLQHLHRFGGITRFDDLVAVAFQGMPQHRAQRVLVFDDEDAGGCGHSTGRGQRSQPGGTPA